MTLEHTGINVDFSGYTDPQHILLSCNISARNFNFRQNDMTFRACRLNVGSIYTGNVGNGSFSLYEGTSIVAGSSNSFPNNVGHATLWSSVVQILG